MGILKNDGGTYRHGTATEPPRPSSETLEPQNLRCWGMTGELLGILKNDGGNFWEFLKMTGELLGILKNDGGTFGNS